MKSTLLILLCAALSIPAIANAGDIAGAIIVPGAAPSTAGSPTPLVKQNKPIDLDKIQPQDHAGAPLPQLTGLSQEIDQAISNGQGCTGATQAIAFTGIATLDRNGNISAGQDSSLKIKATSPSNGDKYEFGRINSTDGSTLEFNLAKIDATHLRIEGTYVMGPEVTVLLSQTCGVSSLSLQQMGTEAMSEAQSVIGSQPFKYAVASGKVVLNGTLNAPY